MVVAYLAVEVVPVAELPGVVFSTHVDFAVFCEKHRVVASCNARHLAELASIPAATAAIKRRVDNIFIFENISGFNSVVKIRNYCDAMS